MMPHIFYPGDTPSRAIQFILGETNSLSLPGQHQKAIPTKHRHRLLRDITLTCCAAYRHCLKPKEYTSPITNEGERAFWADNHVPLMMYAGEIARAVISSEDVPANIRTEVRGLLQQLAKWLRALHDIQPLPSRPEKELIPPWLKDPVRIKADKAAVNLILTDLTLRNSDRSSITIPVPIVLL